MASMQKLGLPLKIAYPLFSAFQIVPLIDLRLQAVKQAQMSRGLQLEGIGIVRRFKTYVPLVTPLLLGAIEEAYRRSIALEARGFSSKVQKTFLRDIRFHRADLCFIIVAVLAVVVISSTIMAVLPQPNPWGL